MPSSTELHISFLPGFAHPTPANCRNAAEVHACSMPSHRCVHCSLFSVRSTRGPILTYACQAVMPVHCGLRALVHVGPYFGRLGVTQSRPNLEMLPMCMPYRCIPIPVCIAAIDFGRLGVTQCRPTVEMLPMPSHRCVHCCLVSVRSTHRPHGSISDLCMLSCHACAPWAQSP